MSHNFAEKGPDRLDLWRELADTFGMGSVWKTWVDALVYDCRARRLTPRTIGAYRERLDCLSHWMAEAGIEPENIDRSIMRRYVVETAGTVADETLAGRLRAWRRLFNFLAEDGLRDGPNPLDGVRIRCEHKVKSVVPPTAFDTVLSACDRKSWVGARNFAMLLTMWDTMARRAEVQALDVTDVDLDGRVLRVQGKGRRERLVPVGDKTVKALHYWMRKRASAGGAALFCTRQGRPLSYTHVHQVVRRTGRKAGVEIGCHAIRHSAATEYLRLGGSLAVLSKILGHSQLSTTSIYVHLSIEDAVKSYERFSPSASLRV